ncbi:hypothetical protein ACOMHN_058174 [Nucella lapillus]
MGSRGRATLHTSWPRASEQRKYFARHFPSPPSWRLFVGRYVRAAQTSSETAALSHLPASQIGCLGGIEGGVPGHSGRLPLARGPGEVIHKRRVKKLP